MNEINPVESLAEMSETVEEKAFNCSQCGQKLCLRKQVINYALGHEEPLFCLKCLAVDADSSEAEILIGIRDYILGRQCFSKEWVKYQDRSFCPCPDNCIPDVCFGD